MKSIFLVILYCLYSDAKVTDLINEKIDSEILEIKQVMNKEISTLRNSCTNDKTFKDTTTGILEKIERLKAQFDGKLKKFKEQTSTTSVIPASEANSEDIDNFAAKVNQKFKKMQETFTEEIENLKKMIQESQNLLADVQRESELRSRTATFNNPDSIKKNIRRNTDSSQRNQEDTQANGLDAYGREDGRIQTFEDVENNSDYSDEKQVEDYDEQKDHEKRLKTLSSKNSSFYNKKITSQIEQLVSKDLKEMRSKIKEMSNMMNKFRTTLNQNSNEIQIAREKLFILIKGEKTNYHTQQSLVQSIKQGIKQIGQNNTSKELNSTFVSKFHTPREGEKSLHKMNTNRALNSPSLLVIIY